MANYEMPPPTGASAALLRYHAAKVRSLNERHRLRAATRAARDDWRSAGSPEPPNELHAAMLAGFAAERGANETWTDESKVLWEEIPAAESVDYQKRWQRWWFRDENAQPYVVCDKDSETAASPSGRYRLALTLHPTVPGCWEYSKAKVYEDDRPIAEVCRNYSSFPHVWLENHPNGHHYLICGEDYQGATVIELDTGERVDYLPEAAQHGAGFCWVRHHPAPDGRLLAVEGCVWAAPYEVRIYDFGAPLQPPWPELLGSGEGESFFGWDSNDRCRIGRTREVVNAPGHPLDGTPYHGISSEQEEALDAWFAERGIDEDDGCREVNEEVEWCRPTDAEAAVDFLKRTIAFRKKRHDKYRASGWGQVPADEKEMAELLVGRLGDEAGAVLRAAGLEEAWAWLQAVAEPILD